MHLPKMFCANLVAQETIQFPISGTAFASCFENSREFPKYHRSPGKILVPDISRAGSLVLKTMAVRGSRASCGSLVTGGYPPKAKSKVACTGKYFAL